MHVNMYNMCTYSYKKKNEINSYVFTEFKFKTKEEFFKMRAPTWLWRMGQVSHFVSTLVCCIQKKEHTVQVADTFIVQKGFSWFTVKISLQF